MTYIYTAAETLAKGAMPQPADGPNAKQEGQKCLTCIGLGQSCQGTDVVGGECYFCRGGTVYEGSTSRKRVCCWLDPANNVHTYQQAQDFLQTTKIPENTREGRAARANDTQGNHGGFAELGTDTLERRLLGQMINQLRGGPGDDSPSNCASLLELTTVAYDSVGTRYTDGSGDSRRYRAAIEITRGEVAQHAHILGSKDVKGLRSVK